jgi:riboflavin kinase/FMN adenylyltransferase
MKLFEGLDTISQPIPRSTVAIGTFDGIHVGHRAIIRTAVEDAKAHDRPALVFTFDRHPAELLAPDRAPAYLTTPEQRNRLISDLKADGLIVARFDLSLSQLSPDTFVEQILKAKLGAEAVVVGTNFAFGKGRAGDTDYLKAAQKRYGFTLHALEPVYVGDAPASSSRIRELLQSGRFLEAEEVLGHPYWLSGRVVEGQKLGRKLGYPTANLELTCRQAVPSDGIYAVRARLEDGREFGGACSIGSRPTIPGAGRSIETFLFDFNENLYGRGMELRFIQFLRAEAKFESLDALIVQMERDVAQAKMILMEDGW